MLTMVSLPQRTRRRRRLRDAECVPMASAATKALRVVARRVRSFSNSHIGFKPLCAAVPSEPLLRVPGAGLGYVGLPLMPPGAAPGANGVRADIDPGYGE